MLQAAKAPLKKIIMAKIAINAYHQSKNNTQTFLEFPEFHAEASQVPVIAVVESNQFVILIKDPEPGPEQKHTDVICADVPEQQLRSITEQTDVIPDMPVEESQWLQPLCVTETCIHESLGFKLIEINAGGFVYWKLYDYSSCQNRESASFLGEGLHYLSLADAMHRWHFVTSRKVEEANV